MIKEIHSDAGSRMGKSIESLKHDLMKVRTGRAHTSLLDSISVEYYGNPTPLNQVANISVLDSRTLSVQVWEKQMTPVVEKAILKSNLGLNPATSGELIRIPLPPLTEETRKGLIKVVRGESENAKVAIRNIRRDANSTLKDLEKEKDISEDEEHRAQDDIQKLTDKYIKAIDQVLSEKEKDLMEI
ncbi:MAG: ribosome recycling factor [gamma proteobacterium symbiont of Taylorina sp.]|nr:ribosome recycling factor [gamma proteobacterium symbiont of Taylorina sp.]